MTSFPHAPPSANDGGAYLFGRYDSPIGNPNVQPRGLLGKYRLKEWHYLSATGERWFVAFALVQLGYVSNAFCYVIDRERPADKREFEALSPGGTALEFAPSSVSGTSRWEGRGACIELSAGAGGWHAQVDVPLGKKRLAGEFDVALQGQSLGLLFDLGSGNAAYTHKAAGLPVTGALRLGSEEIDLGGALGASDWTRSVAKRTTKWKWAALSGALADGRRVGLNLSADVYDKGGGGASQENVLFVDGNLHALGPMHFEVPRHPARDAWRLRSLGDDSLDLEFTPLGAREQRLNLGLIRSDFIQPYGIFHGHISTGGIVPVELSGAFGVVEDHLSVW